MRKLIPFLLAAVVLPAQAHPGEHHAGWFATVWHLVSEPDHLAMAAIAVVVGVAVAKALRHQGTRAARDTSGGKRHDPR